MEGNMAYEKVTFKTMTDKRKKTVREGLYKMWCNNASAEETAKKLRISKTTARTALGNLTRKHGK